MMLDLLLPDAGQGSPILDAACLPSGAALVALGEAGAAVFRDGELVTRFRSPAYHLSVSDDGRHGIAIGQSPEDDRCWLARLDLEGGAESPWCDIARYRTKRYARTFDGERWHIAFEHRTGETTIFSVDATAPAFHVERAVEEPGMLVDIARTRDRLFCLSTKIGAEHFALYALPSLKRIARGDIPCPKIRFPPRPSEPFEIFAGSVHPPVADEPVFAVGGPSCAEPRLIGAKGWTAKLPGTPLGPRALAGRGPWVVVAVEVEAGCELLSMDLRTRSFTGVLRFHGATSVGADLREELLVAWDNRGRAAVIDLGRGAVVQTVDLGAEER